MAKKRVINEKEFKKDVILLINQVFISRLEDLTPVKTGNLKRNWFVFEESENVFVIDNSEEYAKYIDAGTGIYATKGFPNYEALPGRGPIHPTNKKALAFKIKGVGNIIVKSNKGMLPRKILHMLSLSKNIEKDFSKGIDKIFEKHIFKPLEI